LILNKKNGAVYYTFPNLSGEKGVIHGIFTRIGGNSTGPYEGLNVSFGVGDKNENVVKNRQVISSIFRTGDMVSAKQVHGTDAIICQKEKCHDLREDSIEMQAGDALISNENRILLMIKVADCQPVMLYDPKQRVAANIHSGWRGSVQNIIGHTIHVMQDKFGCKSDGLIAGVGPSLGPCCAEFIHYKEEMPEEYWRYNIGNNHFDLWAISRDQLCDAGVLPDNIHMSNMCTKCHTDQFFSYRGEGITGRFGSVIGLE